GRRAGHPTSLLPLHLSPVLARWITQSEAGGKSYHRYGIVVVGATSTAGSGITRMPDTARHMSENTGQAGAAGTAGRARSGSQLVLLTLAAGQFLMTLDSSVMNVSIATVAKDVGTTVTGIQGAITAYTLVMAALMITGAKVGALIGRKRAFAIGCIIYGCGSFTTSIAPNLPVLLF